MSAKGFDEWEDERDDDEEDFVPGGYDEEEVDDCVDYDDDEVDLEDFPSILPGEMFVDKAKGLCYEQDGLFSLTCKTSIPAETFTFGAPVMGSPLLFTGWIKDPGSWMEFEVFFSSEPMSTDPLEMKLLEAQEEQFSIIRSETAKNTGDGDDDNKKSPAKGNLKVPPSYPFKESSVSLKDTAEHCNQTPPPSNFSVVNSAKANEGKMSHVKNPTENHLTQSSARNNMIFVVSGSRIGIDDINDRNITFRGAYRCPSQNSIERIHLICSIQTLDIPATGSGTAMSVAATSVAATSKKRNRSTIDDDNSVEENACVAYQELIDLHDDTRLSTEELRQKYYGGGDTKGEDDKIRAVDTKRLKGTYDRGNSKQGVEDEDDDDAYGF